MSTQTQVKPVRSEPLYKGPIFDADSHMWETPDAWTNYLPKEAAEKFGIKFKTGDDGEYSMYVGPRKVEISTDYLHEDGQVPAPGKLHEWLRAMKEGRGELEFRVPPTPDMTAPEPRLKKLDEWDVRGQIVYMGTMIGAVSYFDDPKWAYPIFNAFNSWMYDHWKYNYKDRIFNAPFVSLANVEESCKQVRDIAAKDGKIILMPMGPFNGKSPAHTDHDAFWEIVNEAHMRVVFHVSEAIYLQDHMNLWGEQMQLKRLKQSAFMWMHGYSERPVIETLSSFIFWNFFERFPNIKLMSAENGAEWVPAMLTKMDKSRGIAKNGAWPGGQLKERPSKIFNKNVWVVAYPEDDVKGIIDQIGTSDPIVMGSDYPHPEGVEIPRDFADEACQGLSQTDMRKVMFENGMRFMDLPY